MRTLVAAPSDLARAGLAEIVRTDTRLVLAGESEPYDLERLVDVLGADVLLEEREALRNDALRVPTVALLGAPLRVRAFDGAVMRDPHARALLARSATPAEIVAAIIAVAAGLIVIAPRLVHDTRRAAVGSTNESGPDRLTQREIDVLRELACGESNRAIAARLHISENTVKFHIAAIFAKLGTSSRTEAVTAGIRSGIVML